MQTWLELGEAAERQGASPPTSEGPAWGGTRIQEDLGREVLLTYLNIRPTEAPLSSSCTLLLKFLQPEAGKS